MSWIANIVILTILSKILYNSLTTPRLSLVIPTYTLIISVYFGVSLVYLRYDNLNGLDVWNRNWIVIDWKFNSICCSILCCILLLCLQKLVWNLKFYISFKFSLGFKNLLIDIFANREGRFNPSEWWLAIILLKKPGYFELFLKNLSLIRIF